jgi:LCP family protein required for cell wall assembly
MKVLGCVFGIMLVVGVGLLAKMYFDTRNAFEKTYKPLKREGSQRNIEKGKPINILLLGIDSGEKGFNGRSDTMIVAHLNPKKKNTILLSIPRDTWVEGVSLNKINSAFADGGAARTIFVVEKLLDAPIHHYAALNFSGIKSLVDVVGGINVNNQLDFSVGGSHFSRGRLHLNGEETERYTRMRYEDPRGDYGRQERQRDAITSLIYSLKSTTALRNYPTILKALGENVQTDISFEEMQDLFKDYKGSFDKIESVYLKGSGEMRYNEEMGKNLSYQIVPQSEISRGHDLLTI